MKKKIVMQISMAAIVCVLGVGLMGCVVHRHGPRKHKRSHGKVVVIKKGHLHGKKCGHYRRHNKWYHAKSHVHGHKCGHSFVRGVWMIK